MDFISALNIIARLPPVESDGVVSDLSTICPRLRSFLMSRMDSRLQLVPDDSTGKLFIASDFNRVGKSYRSPWSNGYIPVFEGKPSDLYFPPDSLRKLEQTLNELLLTYCGLYYDNGVGSAFFAESSRANVFNGVVLIMKEQNDSHTGESHVWESVHSFEVCSRKEGSKALHIDCVMSSTVLTVFDYAKAVPCKLNGSMQKRGSRSIKTMAADFDESVVRLIGELLEEHENSLRASIDKVAIPRSIELALASFGVPDEPEHSSSEEDCVGRVSLGAMNPLHRLSGRPVPAFQADLMGAVAQRRKTQSRNEDE